MSPYKIAGCCTICDEPCFDVLARWEAHEKRAGEPKRLGAPVDGATRIAFVLLDGTHTDLTFCAGCAEAVQPDLYVEIWRKNLRSWLRQLSEKPAGEQRPDWFVKQFSSGLLSEMSRKLWSEIANG